MRFHPQSRATGRDEIDADHHLIHLVDYADIVVPKLIHRQYPAADELYLLECLRKLDRNKQSYLHKKLFVQTLSSMEDALDSNEADECSSFLVENRSLAREDRPDFFAYKRYVKHLLPQRHAIYLELGSAKKKQK